MMARWFGIGGRWGSHRRRDGRRRIVGERTKAGSNEIDNITPETIVGNEVIIS